MLPITVLILTRSKSTETIESALTLDPKEILIGAYEPISVPSSVKKVDLKPSFNYSQDLNELVKIAKNPWILYLKDNETVLQNEEDLEDLLETDGVYSVQVLQEDTIGKEPRLWSKSLSLKFKNPVFEKLNAASSKVIKTMIYQGKSLDSRQDELLDLWKKNQPLSIDACYYKAFAQLSKGNYQDFKNLITHYLFKISKQDIPSVIARYYLSTVQGLIYNDLQSAIQNLTLCIAENPLMAEFWCLLGDLHLNLDKFDKAVAFYENAIILGGRRLSLDFWPMQISKYKKYPEAMIEKCRIAKTTAIRYQAVH